LQWRKRFALRRSSFVEHKPFRKSLKNADEPGETCAARLLKWQLRGFSALSDPAKDALRTSLRVHRHFSNSFKKVAAGWMMQRHNAGVPNARLGDAREMRMETFSEWLEGGRI